MLEKLETLRKEAEALLQNIADLPTLQKVKQDWLGKNGKITELLKAIPTLEPEQRRPFGIGANEIKTLLTDGLASLEEKLIDSAGSGFKLDLTIPGVDISQGGLHPTRQMRDDLNQAFARWVLRFLKGVTSPPKKALSIT